MPTPPKIQTFRDPAFSRWQSAVHATLLKQQPQGATAPAAGGLASGALASGGLASGGLAATANHPYMVATIQAVQQLQNGPAPAAPVSPVTAAAVPEAAATASAAPVVQTVGDCAKLVALIAWDELFDTAKVPALKDELADSTCDPFWAECLAVYEASLVSGESQPYTVYTSLGQYVLANCFPDTATIAIIGDWGTGASDALVLLQQIAANFKPDVLIHLGDIYYSGLPVEDSDNFTKVISQVWPQNPPLIFTLDGNHDRYAGAGGGYYTLIAGLNQAAGLPQPNSYFALRNNFWQFIATDTGYHDTDPFTVNTNVTYLEQTEINWHLDKIKNNGAGVNAAVNPSGVRGTVLLSHHQLISATGVGSSSTGVPLAVNMNLANAFSPVLNLIDFWLWGHEHDLCIFEPYSMGPGQPLPPCRCVGASAIPVFSPAPAPPEEMVLPMGVTERPTIVPGTGLGNNGTIFNRAYAIVTLNNAALSIDYYQFDSTAATPGQPPAPTPAAYRDSVAGPRAANPAASGAGGD